MVDLLYIVSQRQPWLYEHLRNEFSDAPGIEVVLDRRRRERRQAQRTPTTEARVAERRQPIVDPALDLLGWVIARRAGPSNERA